MNSAAITALLLIASLVIPGCKKDDESPAKKSSAATATAVDQPPAVPPVPSTHPGLLGPGDVLDIVIGDPADDVHTLARVMADNTVPLPYVGAVKLGGLSETDAEAAAIQTYVKANILEANHEIQVQRLQVNQADRLMPIQVGDLVRIAVGGVSRSGGDSVRISRVQNDGFVSMSYLKKLKIAGLTESQAQQAIIDAYRKENILVNASVSVFVLEAAPPDAAQRDLPDAPLKPVPREMERFFVSGIVGDAPPSAPARK